MSAAPKSEARVFADEPVIEITRLLDAPRELVWECFTDPKHLAHWWGPNGFSITTHSHAARSGGKWDFVMHGPDGTDYNNLVVYTEVTKPERLVYDHRDPGGDIHFHAVITLTIEGGKTRVVMRSRFPSLAARDHVVREFGAVEGGKQTLDRLGAYLATQEA
ncbi:MAG: SRPBCC family protein [Alphaproteobacteria bacterium]|nr:SRPBCC family protein [Alphaproteobacteria bacterium]MBL7098634.1 SRPBCC family protein [Alphaproteobacteria bacterium]